MFIMILFTVGGICVEHRVTSLSFFNNMLETCRNTAYILYYRPISIGARFRGVGNIKIQSV